MSAACAVTATDLHEIIRLAVDEFQPVANSGIAVAVIGNGEVLFSGGFGLRDRAANLPVDAQTCFAAGSANKAFTSMALSILAEQNQIDLTVPVRQLVPDFKMKDPAVTAQITLTDILAHRSGLPRHDLLWYLGPFSRTQLFHRLRDLAGIPGGFRNSFLYNNLMYTAAGTVVEAVTGQSWEAVVQARILDPLAMNATSVSLDRLVGRANHARGYNKAVDVPLRDFSNIGPAGALNSTALDMATWVQVLLAGGRTSSGTPIVKANSLQKMLAPVTPVAAAIDYGLGWFVAKLNGKRFIFHHGDAEGGCAYVSFMPDDGIGVIALSNQQRTQEVFGTWPDKVIGRIYAALLAAPGLEAPQVPVVPPPPPLPLPPSTGAPPPLSAFTGLYAEPGYGDIVIGMSGPALVMSYYSTTFPLARVGNLTFAFRLKAFGMEVPVRVFFAADAAGAVESLAIRLEPTLDPIRFMRR